MARTERKSDSRREMADLLVLSKPARACRMAQASADKLEHTGPTEKEKVASVPQRKQLASMLFLFICHIYPPFTRKRIVSLYFGREVRTRLGVAFF